MDEPTTYISRLPFCPGNRASCVGNRRGKCLCLTDTNHITPEKPCKFYDDGSKAEAAERRLEKLRAQGRKNL